jgi:heptosyltransferase-2
LKTLAVFLPNWIGDAVMATPTLRALRTRYASTHTIIGVGRPGVIDVLAGTQLVDEVIEFDPKAKQRQLRVSSVIGQLRRVRPDVAVLLTNSWRTALIARLGGARRRFGYAREGRGWLLSDPLTPERQDGKYVPGSVVDYYMRLAMAAGCPADSLTMQLTTSPDDECRADKALRRLGVPDKARLVVVNNGGAFGAAKLWPTTHFAALTRRLVEDHPVHVVALCGPAERDMARDICQQASHRRVVGLYDEELSLGLSKALVRRSELMVTTDSGPRHFAAAFDTPVVTLFGPTHIAWSENYHSQATHLQLHVDCGPCQQRTCPLSHHRCMQELSVDHVYEAAARWLTTPSQAEPAEAEPSRTEQSRKEQSRKERPPTTPHLPRSPSPKVA